MNNRSEEIRIMSLPGMQEKFREAMGPWQRGDWGYSPQNENLLLIEDESDVAWENQYDSEDPLIRLPLPIDPVNPERGLWGMVKWNRDVFIISDGDMAIEGITAGCEPPTLSLLKALAHQWEIDLEEK